MADSIVCVCSNCDAKLRLKNPDLAGKRIRCPKCAEPFLVIPLDAESDSPPTTSKLTKPSKPAKPTPKPAEDDIWLNDLENEEEPVDEAPPVVKKKKKKASVPEEIRERKRSEEGREHSLATHYVMMAVTGMLGGLVGAAIWAALIYFTGFEIGYIAVFVGACAGIGVRLGASQWDYGLGPGLLAVAVAIVALIGGKVVGGRMHIRAELAKVQAEMVQFQHDNYLIAEIAQEYWAEHPEGQPLSQPELDEETIEDGEFGPEMVPKSYPKEIWEKALAKWNGMTDAERQKVRDERKELLDEEFEIPAALLFGPYDILWFFLAVGAAFRIATGDNDD